MKLSLNWLKDYVDPKLSTDELVHRLTMAGLEVEEVHSVGKDTVLDLEITPNRPDCLNTIGLAREISAITAKALKLPKVKAFKPTKTKTWSIRIDDTKDCPQYIGTVIESVHVASSNATIKERVEAIGNRAINNAVDITNFVLMEMGQPLHVFDADKIEGKTIIVRRAKTGESIITLDGIKRDLNPSILVIADARKPIAIAGIMGGKDTEVTESTKNILLESAQFDMGLVRRASRSLGLKSDSSYRFERGIDVQSAMHGANRATEFLLKECKGALSARIVAGKTIKVTPHKIEISVNDIEGLLGTKVSAPQVSNALKRLGLGVAASKTKGFKISIPSFRGDLKQKVDLIEEVARVIGYDRLDVSFPFIQVHNIVPNSVPRQVKKTAGQILLANGYSEAITFSLINKKDLEKSSLPTQDAIAVHNALSAQHNLMRTSLFPSLLNALLTNVNRGQKDVRLFEMGKCYFVKGERATLGLIATGKRQYDWRSNNREQLDLYDIKGHVQQMFCRLGADVQFEQGTYPGLQKSICALLKLNNHVIGAVGKVEKSVLAAWDIKIASAFFAQIDLQPLFDLSRTAAKFMPLPEFPSVVRDVSIAVKDGITFGQIKSACRAHGGDILQDITLVEEYVGDKIQSGHRGLVFSLTYQSTQRTLREEDVNNAHWQICRALNTQFSAIMR